MRVCVKYEASICKNAYKFSKNIYLNFHWSNIGKEYFSGRFISYKLPGICLVFILHIFFFPIFYNRVIFAILNLNSETRI